MLRRRRHPRRAGQRGQTLILALVFIAFFGTVTVAILRVADVTGSQQGRTQDTAGTDAGEEGGAAYAAADAGRTDLSLTCGVGNTGRLVMETTGDQANYSVRACNPGATGGGNNGAGPGINCVLCILNFHPFPPNPATVAVYLHCAQCTTSDVTTTGGDVYVNGSMSIDKSLTANPDAQGNPAHIRVLYGATYTAGCCSPTPTTYAPAIGDPLASDLAPSPAVPNSQSACTGVGGAWSAANGCSLNVSTGTKAISPGVYSSISLSGSAQVTMSSGVYAITGPISVSGNSSKLSGTGVTLFLTCPGYGSGGALCAANGGLGTKGATITETGNSASVAITAPGSAQYAADQLAILADPNLADPGACGGGGVQCVIQTAGTGAGVSGTVDLRSSGISMQGNGGDTISGRLIANALDMSVTGKIGTGLTLGGSFPGVSTSSCGVFDDNVSGGGAAPPTGRAVVQSQCGTGGALSGIVDMNYVP